MAGTLDTLPFTSAIHQGITDVILFGVGDVVSEAETGLTPAGTAQVHAHVLATIG